MNSMELLPLKFCLFTLFLRVEHSYWPPPPAAQDHVCAWDPVGRALWIHGGWGSDAALEQRSVITVGLWFCVNDG